MEAAASPAAAARASRERAARARTRYRVPVSTTPDSNAVRLSRLVRGGLALPATLAGEVDAAARVLSVVAGAQLFDEGSPCTGMLVLEAGAVRVSLAAPSGRELLLYRVLPGETCVLTLSCLLGQASYPARGVADSDVTGLFLPAALFERLVEVSPAFRDFVFAAFSARLREVLGLASAVTFDRLDRRLSAALLERVERTGRIELAVTHQQLADELGCAREPVSRLLEGLEQRGAVELGRGRVRVKDKALLAAAPGRD